MTTEESEANDALAAALAEPFDAREVKFKPGVISGNRALALAYIDARLVQDRLNAVFGVDGWQDGYDFLPNGSVVCHLSVRVKGEWIAKTDVGSESEQPDGGDRTKAAVSDALKRAAVKLGIGRYLYNLPAQWVDYDPQKKRFAHAPGLPEFAKPSPEAAKVKEAKAAEALRERAVAILAEGDKRGLAALESAWHSLSLKMREAAAGDYLRIAAKSGKEAFEAAWTILGKQHQPAVKSVKDELKKELGYATC